MTITEKITRAKADIDAVHGAGYGKGFDEGRNEGKEAGYADGYDNGIAEGREQGKDEAYAEVEPLNAQLEQILYGRDTGGEGFWGEFWDIVQKKGTRNNYYGGFRHWDCEYIRPKYKAIHSTGDISYAFSANPSLKAVEKKYFDASQCPPMTHKNSYTCKECPSLLVFEDIGLPSMTHYHETWYGCTSLHTIEILRVEESSVYSDTFRNCKALENLTIEGTIGQSYFNVGTSTKLSKASITSIINALSTTASGKSVTLSKTAVNKAFEASVGANNGTTSEQWLNLIATKSNWTISLV